MILRVHRRRRYYQPERLFLVSLLIAWHIQCRANALDQNDSVSDSDNTTLPININTSLSISKLPHQLLLWGDNLLEKLSTVYSMYSQQSSSKNVSAINAEEEQLKTVPHANNNNGALVQSNLKDLFVWNSIPKNLENDGSKDNDLDSDSKVNKVGVISEFLDETFIYPGDLGSGVTTEDHNEQQQKLITQGYEKFGFNEFVSNLVPYNRTVPDFRNEWCQKESQTYSNELSPASVIITFHNEAKSTLVRTLYSILARTNGDLLQEILLINDFSNEENFKESWLENIFPNQDKIRVINTLQNEGVARARTLGAINAKGPVLIFLDSHVEVTEGWLEPLLHRISLSEKAVVAPTIDVIDANTFRLKASNSTANKVGIFDWKLEVKRKPAREALMKKRSSPAEPVESPVVPFGMFAIYKPFFKSLGYFDTEFTKWGGEALDLSFKVWMCGGKVEISPCSHVGHVFKGEQPEEHKTAMRTNLHRLANTWLDHHAHYYHEMSLSGADGGETSERQSRVKADLQCKPFSWYLENIAPEVFNPHLSVGEGEIRNGAFGFYFCMDASSDLQAAKMPAGVWPCHQFGGNQYWHYSNFAELRRVDLCLDYSDTLTVIMYYCDRHSKTQKWLYDYQTQQLRHPSTSKCLALNPSNQLLLEDCNPEAVTQKWTFGSLNEDRLQKTLKTEFNIIDFIT